MHDVVVAAVDSGHSPRCMHVPHMITTHSSSRQRRDRTCHLVIPRSNKPTHSKISKVMTTQQKDQKSNQVQRMVAKKADSMKNNK